VIDVAQHPSELVEEPTAAVPARPVPKLRWWRELAVALVVYKMYELIRGGADTGASPDAFRNARWIVEIEQATFLAFERSLQQLVLPFDWLVTFTNNYYGTAHFLVTAGVMVWLYLFRKEGYRHMRNVFGIMMVVGLVIFWLFPLAPPRMLPCNDSIPVAAAPDAPALGECLVDTLHSGTAVLSYKSEAAKAITNPYAAMPSFHFGWALWCGLAVSWYGRSRWLRRIGWFHVSFTTFAIIVTANHYVLDAVGGGLVVALGCWGASRIERSRRPVEAATEPAATMTDLTLSPAAPSAQ
jgi:hypothetical protein